MFVHIVCYIFELEEGLMSKSSISVNPEPHRTMGIYEVQDLVPLRVKRRFAAEDGAFVPIVIRSSVRLYGFYCSVKLIQGQVPYFFWAEVATKLSTSSARKIAVIGYRN